MRSSKIKAVSLLLTLPLILSGCGVLDSAVSAVKGFIFFLAVVSQIIFCVVAGVMIGDIYIHSKRGTNVMSRFARTGVMSLSNTAVTLLGIVVAIIGALLGWLAKGFVGSLICIPTLIVTGAAMYFLNKSTDSEQRIEDARYVTKAVLDGTSQVAGAVGTAVGKLTPSESDDEAFTALGDAVGDVAANASANMQVEGAAQLDLSATAEALPKALDPALLMTLAGKTGIPVEDRALIDIANDVIKFAPESSLKRIDRNASVEEQAMQILLGTAE